MPNNSIDLIFPTRAIESLKELRGESWQSLVDSVSGLEYTHPGRIAFVLFMVRIGGCATCQSDSFRAMRGCVLCGNATIKRYKASDQSLIDLYIEAKKDVVKYMKEV